MTTMHFKFEPNVGAQPLTFGADRTAMHSLLAPLVPKAKITQPENDFYIKQGLILGFDRQNKLEFIEVFPPSTAEFSDVHFFGETVSQILTRLTDLGLSHKKILGTYRFDSVGISLYCPNQVIESASLFRAGYYESSS
jgi:hypothetical protein